MKFTKNVINIPNNSDIKNIDINSPVVDVAITLVFSIFIPCIMKFCNFQNAKNPNPDDNAINNTPSKKYVNFINNFDTPDSRNSNMSLFLAFIPKLVKLYIKTNPNINNPILPNNRT